MRVLDPFPKSLSALIKCFHGSTRSAHTTVPARLGHRARIKLRGIIRMASWRTNTLDGTTVQRLGGTNVEYVALDEETLRG